MPMEKTHAVGKDCKLYYNTGTRAVPVWVLISKAINVALNLSKGEADAGSRETPWKLQKGALKELELTFSYRYLKGGADAVFEYLRDMFLNDTCIEFAVVDGDITTQGALGVKIPCEVFGMNVAQELESTQEVEFTLKPAYKDESGYIPPLWFETP
jgi:hypothetical protein